MDIVEWTAEDVRALYESIPMSQVQFAKRLGVSGRTVNGWAAGRTISQPNRAVLDTVFHTLNPQQRARFRHKRGLPAQQDEPVNIADALDRPFPLAGDTAHPDRDRLEWMLADAGRADDTVISHIRDTLHSQMLLDDTIGGRAVQGVVMIQHRTVEALLGDCPANPEGLKRRLVALYAELTGFAGCLAWDHGDPSSAKRLYNEAYENAHDAQANDLAGYMLCHLAQLAADQGHPRVAIDHATRAVSWTAHSDDTSLRAYASLRAAHAYARDGQAKPCREALDRAQGALATQTQHPRESLAYFCTPGLYWSIAGECLAAIDNPGDVEALRKALDLIGGGQVRDKALSILDLGRSLLRHSEMEEAAALVGEAADLAVGNRSRRLAERIVAARGGLSPWSSEPAVKTLDDKLATVLP